MKLRKFIHPAGVHCGKLKRVAVLESPAIDRNAPAQSLLGRLPFWSQRA
jgi:hypothetical protein